MIVLRGRGGGGGGSDDEEEDDDDGDSSEELDLDPDRPVSPCNFTFVGANVTTGKSSIRSKPKEKKVGNITNFVKHEYKTEIEGGTQLDYAFCKDS